MRVLGAIELSPGTSIVARIKYVSEQVFTETASAFSLCGARSRPGTRATRSLVEGCMQSCALLVVELVALRVVQEHRELSALGQVDRIIHDDAAVHDVSLQRAHADQASTYRSSPSTPLGATGNEIACLGYRVLRLPAGLVLREPAQALALLSAALARSSGLSRARTHVRVEAFRARKSNQLPR